jgi:2-polyprenyl-6-methoxyphenol hydroxylase-like FAD-dependent oxidoreductase
MVQMIHQDVLIIGAGIVGLTLAHALKRVSWETAQLSCAIP